MKLIQSEKTGQYSVRFKTRSGKEVTRSLGTTSKKEANTLVKEAKIEELEMASKINALTKDAIASIVADRNISFGQCLKEWTEYAKVRCKSNNTVYTQTTILDRFASYSGVRKLSDITADHVANFINEKCDVKLNSRNQRLAAIRSFISYAVANSYILTDPTIGVRVDASKLSHSQKESKRRVPFTKADYSKLVAHAPYFFKQAVMLGWWTGLRAIDVCKLEWDSWGEDHLTVWTEKTDTRIQLPYDNPLIGGGVLRKVITEIEVNKTRYCFPEWAEIISDPNKRSRFSVYFNRFLKRMEIEDKSFHSFRHSFVTRIKEEDYNSSLEKIAKWVGHSRVETTKGYLHETS
jgi:integrase